MSQDNGTGPAGGRTGATIMALVPFIAAIIFFVLGFTLGAWAWAWIFFLAIPIAGIIIYGPNRNR